MESITAVVGAILALGVLITVHEAGHYWAARLSGMSVRRFSVGFGPAIFRTTWDGTEFQFALLPLGGYAQIDGLSPQDGSDPNAPESYRNKPFHLRFLTVLAGPVANYVLAFGLLFLFHACFFYDARPPVRVLKVAPGSGAEKAGLLVGDLVLGTEDALFESLADLSKAVDKAQDQPFVLRLTRDGVSKRVEVQAQKKGDRYLLGIGYEGATRVVQPKGLREGARAAAAEVWGVSARIVQMCARGIAGLLGLGPREPVAISGPVGVVGQLASELTRSWLGAMRGIAFISISLGAFNLFPIPALDGSRLLFLGVGLIRRREIEPKFEALVHSIGFVLLLGLLILVSIADIFG